MRRFGRFLLDPEGARLTTGGAPIELQPKVLDLVILLSGQPGRIFTRQELLDALWPGVHVTEASLHQALRKARKALGDDPDAPRFVEAVSRRGWRWIAAVEETNNGSDGFVGRREELRQLDERLLPGAAVVLHGPGGIGKTRLAREVVLRGAREHRFVAVGGSTDPADLIRRLAGALELVLLAGDPADAIERALGGRDLVVVLDEVEGVARATGELVERWRAAAPAVSWLLTSRVVVPGVELVPVGPLPADDAAELLQRHLPREVGRLAEPEAVAVLEPLEGLPLAIELAASRLRVLEPARLAARLRDSLRVLAEPGRGLWASLGASFALLDPADRALLAAGAAFPGPFDADGLEQVAGTSGDSVLDGLARLLDASLVRRDPDGLRITGLVREHAAAVEPEVHARAVQRWVAQVVEAASPAVAEAIRWKTGGFRVLRDLLDELLAAARAARDPVARDTLAVAIGLGCRYSGPWDLAWAVLSPLPDPSPAARVLTAEYALRLGQDPGERLADRVDSAPAAEPLVRGWAALLRARVASARGSLDHALAEATASERWAAEAGCDGLMALALDARGAVLGGRGDLDGLRDSYDRALARLDQPNHELVRAIVAQNQAASLALAGRRDEAIPRLRLAVDAADAVGWPHVAAVARANLGTAMLEDRRAAEAAPLLSRSLADARALGDLRSVRKHAEELALALLLTGDGVEAERRLHEALGGAAGATTEAVPSFGAFARAARLAWAAELRGDRALAQTRLASARALAPDEATRARVDQLAARPADRQAAWWAVAGSLEGVNMGEAGGPGAQPEKRHGARGPGESGRTTPAPGRVNESAT